MISIQQIGRLIETGGYERLVDRVLENGRSRNLALRLRLTRPEAAEAAALGLGLQRGVELSYGPCPRLAHLAARLVHLQGVGGLLEATCEHEEREEEMPGGPGLHDGAGRGRGPGGSSVAASAVGIRGLMDYIRLKRETGAVSEPHLDVAVDRGIHALAGRQQSDGSIGADPVEDAIILWQLGGTTQFRDAVRIFELGEVVDRVQHERLIGDLHRLARTTAA